MAVVQGMSGAQVSRLSGGRLHLHHGPIDIVFRAFGEGAAVAAVEARAVGRFQTVLDELVGELPLLRREADGGPGSGSGAALEGEIARAMVGAVLPHVIGATEPSISGHRRACPDDPWFGKYGAMDPRNKSEGDAVEEVELSAHQHGSRPFVTPMAAVAGSVADAVLGAAVGPGVVRAYANNGGDAALWLAPGEAMRVAIGGSGDRAVVREGDPVRGVATSGWRGRSHSLGIADAVTVLAGDAAAADVAATLIANALDLPGSRKVSRVAACEIDPDSDLGDRLVTRDVGALSAAEISEALARGVREAEAMRARGLIHAAVLYLGGRHAVVGGVSMVNLETCDG